MLRTGGFAPSQGDAMGDKSPKSKQRGKDQKAAAKAQVKSSIDKRQLEAGSTLMKGKKK
jgi:hypothetical protein